MLTDVECAGSVIVQESLLAECGMEVGHGGGLVHRHSSGGGSTDGIACVNLLVRCGDGVAFAHCGEIVGDYSQIRASLSAQEQFVGTISDVNHLSGGFFFSIAVFSREPQYYGT